MLSWCSSSLLLVPAETQDTEEQDGPRQRSQEVGHPCAFREAAQPGVELFHPKPGVLDQAASEITALRPSLPKQAGSIIPSLCPEGLR